MKNRTGFFVLLALLAAGIGALEGSIEFVDGTVDIRYANGELDYADFGMAVKEGDTIITGRDGYAEIGLEGGSRISIEADTVFTYQRGSVAPDREPEAVLQVVKGQVGFRFRQLAGREPNIRAHSTVAGIRGTEFTVVVGEDGQSLFVISEGAVAVSAAGSEVELGADEAVEVSLAEGLGQKYQLQSASTDFSGWRDDARDRALQDPAGTLRSMTGLLQEYVEKAEYFYGLFQEGNERFFKLSEEIARLRKEGDIETADSLADGEFLQLKSETINLGLNYRYNALSAVSLRRYVVASLYVQERTAAWPEAIDGDFEAEYRRFLEIYENRAVPYLVRADV